MTRLLSIALLLIAGVTHAEESNVLTLRVTFTHPTTPNGETLTVASGSLEMACFTTAPGSLWYRTSERGIYTDQGWAEGHMFWPRWSTNGYQYMVLARFPEQIVNGPFGTTWRIVGDTVSSSYKVWPSPTSTRYETIHLPLRAERILP